MTRAKALTLQVYCVYSIERDADNYDVERLYDSPDDPGDGYYLSKDRAVSRVDQLNLKHFGATKYREVVEHNAKVEAAWASWKQASENGAFSPPMPNIRRRRLAYELGELEVCK